MKIVDLMLEGLDMVTDRRSLEFCDPVFRRVQTDAYHIAEKNGNKRTPKEYWDIAKQYLALRFTQVSELWKTLSKEGRLLETALTQLKLKKSGIDFSHLKNNGLEENHANYILRKIYGTYN